jgi:hypothetical protein
MDGLEHQKTAASFHHDLGPASGSAHVLPLISFMFLASFCQNPSCPLKRHNPCCRFREGTYDSEQHIIADVFASDSLPKHSDCFLHTFLNTYCSFELSHESFVV